MENFVLDQDIKIFCLTASSFPEGAMAVHQQLDKLVPFVEGRNYFGLSRPDPSDKNKIIYKSAAEEMSEGELKHLNLEEITIKKGNYVSVRIPDFMKNIPMIGKSFQEMISLPEIDPEGWCVEWMLRDGAMRCMVRLSDK
jgi:hypothetical protein